MILIKAYPSASSLVAAFTQEVDTSAIGGVTNDGSPSELSLDQFIFHIERQGLWGFFEADALTIHVWAASETSFEQVLELFAHEVGHYVERDPIPDIGDDFLQEELRVERYATVSVTSFHLTRRYFESLL